MHRKALTVATASLILLASACSDHIVEPLELADGRVVGTVHGILSDYGTHQILDSAAVKITWMQEGIMHTAWSGSLGYYAVTGLGSGQYELTFWGSDDYAVSRMTIVIPKLDEVVNGAPATDEDYAYSVALNVDLYRKDAGISGTVLKTEADLSTTAAAGVTVIADYTFRLAANMTDRTGGYNVYPGRYTTVTDNSGFFSFDSLPGTPSVVIYTMPYTSGGRDYGMRYAQPALHSGAILELDGDMVLTVL
ncbi:carboxypeptidase regulatory-like domain-containing protein [bacterium]|nr:carboxypeptidase regulatory-like domain-containing protein [bacterium]